MDILTFIGLAGMLLLMPGPTNTLLMTSGLRVGLRNALPLVPAEAIGYAISITGWGLLIRFVSSHAVWLTGALKIFCFLYLCWLSYKLWTTANKTAGDIRVITPKLLVLATMLNPKALVFSTTIFPAYVWHSGAEYIIHMMLFFLLIVPISILWITIGGVFSNNSGSVFNQCNLQRMASVVIVCFAGSLMYSFFNEQNLL